MCLALLAAGAAGVLRAGDFLLPCDMSFDTFFIDPYGDVMPCNGTKDKQVMLPNFIIIRLIGKGQRQHALFLQIRHHQMMNY